MNKQKYLAELAGLLSFLVQEDRGTVINYYARKFDAAGEEGESAIIAELGTPMRLAIQLNREGIDAIIEAEESAARLSEEEAPAAGESGGDLSEIEDANETAEEESEAEEDEPAEEDGDATLPPQEAELVEILIEDEPEEEEEEETPEYEPETDDEADTVDTAALIDQVKNGLEEEHNESFPELTVARGKTPPDNKEKARYRISVWGAIAFFILMIVPGVPLLLVSAALVPLLLTPFAASAAAALIGFRAGLASLAYIPDAMFVLGVALIAAGLGLLLLIFGIWLISRIVLLWKNGLPALFGKLVRREAVK